MCWSTLINIGAADKFRRSFYKKIWALRVQPKTDLLDGRVAKLRGVGKQGAERFAIAGIVRVKTRGELTCRFLEIESWQPFCRTPAGLFENSAGSELHKERSRARVRRARRTKLLPSSTAPRRDSCNAA